MNNSAIRTTIFVMTFIFLFFSDMPATIYFVLLTFSLVSFLRGHNPRIMASLIVIASVTFVSLLSPCGRILFSLGKFSVTHDALLEGLSRGGKLCAYVMVSKATFSKEIQLPGHAGSFFAMTMKILADLTREKIEMKSAGIIERIDEILLKVWNKNLEC